MNRRELLGSTLGALLFASGAFARGTPEADRTRAIAEGGPLTAPKDHPIQVAIVVSRGTTWIDFVGPLAVFETFYFDPVEKKHKPHFKSYLVSEKLEPAGRLLPEYTFQTAPPAQIVLVPAQPGSQAMWDYLRESSATTDITMSVCTGARHLAHAGLLDGKQATTHHEAIDDYTKEFPKVKWVRGMRFVEGPNISTGGGLTAGIDLALRVTERYFGRDWAAQVAEHLEYQGKGWMV